MLNFDFISDEKYSSILIRPWKQKQKKNKNTKPNDSCTRNGKEPSWSSLHVIKEPTANLICYALLLMSEKQNLLFIFKI